MAESSTITSVEIQAVDNTGQAFTNVQNNLKKTADAAQQAGKQAGGLGQGIVGGLAGVPEVLSTIRIGFASLGIYEVARQFANLINSSMQATNELRILAAQAGTTVEKFQIMRQVGEEAGIGPELMARMVSKMNEAMALAVDVTSKEAYVLKSLGVNAKDASDATLQFLRSVQGLGTEQEKIAALTDQYGARQARLMLPLLDDIIKRYQDAKRVIEETGAAPSINLLMMARQFHEQTEKLALAWQGVKNAVAETFGPQAMAFLGVLTSLLEKIREARGLLGQGDLAASAAGRVASGRIGGPATVGAQLPGAGAIGMMGGATGTRLPPGVSLSGPAAPGGYAAGGGGAEDEATRVRRTYEAWVAHNKAVEEARTLLAQYYKTVGEMQVEAAKETETYEKQENERVQYLIELRKEANKELGDGERLIEQINHALAKALESQDKYEQSIIDANDRMELQIGIVGMLPEEAARLTAEFEAQRSVQEELLNLYSEAGDLWYLNVEASQQVVDNVNKLADRMPDVVKSAGNLAAALERARTGDQIANDLANGIMRGFEQGKSYVQNFKEELKRQFNSLVLQPIIKFILAPLGNILAGISSTVVGGLTGGGGLGGANLAGAGLNWAAGGFGNPLAPFASIFNLGAGSAVTASIPEFMGGAGVSATIGAFGAPTLASIVGAVAPWALAGFALFSMFGNKDPSQVRGRLMFSGGAGGFEDSAYVSSRYFGNVGFRDQDTQYFSGQAAKAFDKVIVGMLDAIGDKMTSGQRTRTAAALQAANLPSMEGEYTTEAFLTKYGGLVLKQVVDIAMNELNPALVGLVDAFQGADEELPKFVDSLLKFNDVLQKLPDDIQQKLIAAASGSQEILDKLIAFGALYKNITDLMNADPLADERMLEAQSTLMGAMSAQGHAVEELAAKYDGSVEASEALNQATVAYYNSLVKALAQIKAIKEQIDSMFGDTERNIRLSLMTDQQRFEYYQEDAKKAEQMMLASRDPEAIQRWAQRYNEDLNAAWNLLTPDQQKQYGQNFIDDARRVNAEADARLQKATDTLVETWNTIITDVRNTLNEAADRFVDAAKNMQNAADTPQEVHVTVDDAVATAAPVGQEVD